MRKPLRVRDGDIVQPDIQEPRIRHDHQPALSFLSPLDTARRAHLAARLARDRSLHALVDRLQRPLHAKIVLELDGDDLLCERLEYREHELRRGNISGALGAEEGVRTMVDVVSGCKGVV